MHDYTPTRPSRLYLRPPNKQLTCVIIINVLEIVHVKFALCRIQQHIMKAYGETKVQVHTFFPGSQMDVSGKFPTLANLPQYLLPTAQENESAL